MPDDKKKNQATDAEPAEADAGPEAAEVPESTADAAPEAAEAAAGAETPEAGAEPPVEEPEAASEPEPVAEVTAPPAGEPEPEAAAAEAPPALEPEPAAAATAAAEPAPAEPEPKKSRKRLPRALRRTRTKRVRERAATRKPIVRTPGPESEPGRRQERRGVVISDKGDKTIVVSVDVTKIHPRYKKVVRRSRRFHAHDEQNAAGIGDVVRIVETRPLSKTKCWRLAEIVEKAK
jgi:small subunit ribosomal protein S17